MLDDRLVTNRALLDYQKGLFGQVAILQFFQREGPYEFSPKLRTNFRSPFGGNILEIMFDDRLVTEQALLDYKKGQFGQVAILEFFQRGDPMNLVKN